MLRDLQKSTLDNRSAFDQAGVTVFDASGEMANLGEIIGDLEDHLSGLSDEQKRVALTTPGFQERSLASLITLLGTSDAIRGYEAALRDAAGTTKSVAEKQLQSLAAQFDLLKSHVEVAMINIGGAIAPLVEFLFGPLRATLSWVSGLFESNNRFARIAAQGVAILGAGLLVLSGFLFVAALAVRGYAFALTSLKIPQMIATLWNSNFILSLRLAAIAVTGFAVRLWTSGTAALGRFKTAIRTNVIPALSRFATTIWTSTIGALRALGRRLAMASLAMLRFATRAIVAGISAVITFGAAIWASLIPPLIAATAAVVGFTLALLANPIVLIVMAIIGAFVALGFVVYKFRRQILGALKFAWNWIKGNWPLLVGILLGPFGIEGALVWKFRRQIVDALMGVWNWAKGNWPLLVGILFGPFGIAAGLIFKFRDDIVDAIMWIKDQSTSIFTALRDSVIGIWQGVGAAIGGAFRGVINAVISGLNKALDAASSFVEAIKGALDKAPFGNPLGDFLLGVASKLRAGIPNFAIGGIVPGPLGRPLLATVHGGEMVLPVGASKVLAQMLEGFRLGPAALPQAPPGYGQMYRSSVTNRTVNINMNEPIVIHTQATDAKGIAQELGEAIQDQIRNIAYDHDGPVER